MSLPATIGSVTLAACEAAIASLQQLLGDRLLSWPKAFMKFWPVALALNRRSRAQKLCNDRNLRRVHERRCMADFRKLD
jgi:hypothetical protein